MSIFVYKKYKELLNLMKKTNKIYTFKEISKDIISGIILRHDIDIDIEKAYDLSQIEEEENVNATYFVLTTADVYNPCSLRNRKFLKQIYRSGHNIGLHFDPSIYKDIDEEQLLNKVKCECNILESIIDDKVEAISLHCPSIHNKYPIFKEYKNAYEKRFFNPEYYISDSCKDFRGKDILSFIQYGKDHIIQVVLHPIHFFQTNISYTESFNYIFENKINTFDDYMRINKTYKNEIENEKLLYKFCDYINNYKK